METYVYIWGAMTRTVVKECAAKRVFIRPLFLILLVAWTTPASGQSLRGSSKSLDLQNRVAEEHDFTYIDTPERVGYFASQGWLVRVSPNRDFQLHAVSFPFARPEVALFIERLSRQYMAACGEQLVITSLTRPPARQPRTASGPSGSPALNSPPRYRVTGPATRKPSTCSADQSRALPDACKPALLGPARR